MYEKTTRLTLPELCRFLGCDRSGANYWIKNGKLTISRIKDENYRPCVTMSALIRFLYFNPRIRSSFEQTKCPEEMADLKARILTEVYEYGPLLVTKKQLCALLQVNEDTIRYWREGKRHHKRLHGIKDARSTSGILYSVNDIWKFFEENPYYMRTYGAFLTRSLEELKIKRSDILDRLVSL